MRRGTASPAPACGRQRAALVPSAWLRPHLLALLAMMAARSVVGQTNLTTLQCVQTFNATTPTTGAVTAQNATALAFNFFSNSSLPLNLTSITFSLTTPATVAVYYRARPLRH